jgi:nucleoside-diphosphate-sugar epimerase
MALDEKIVLVTGATGCVGGRLIEKLFLDERAKVRVLVRNLGRLPRIARFPIEWVKGDITDPAIVQQAVQGCEVVFHCAYDFSAGRDEQRSAAILGTRNVAEAVLHAAVPRLVYVSSLAVYGAISDVELTELSPWHRTASRYAQLKRASERLVLKLHREKGLPVVVLQPTLVYGPFSVQWTIGPSLQLKTGLVPLVDGGGGLCNAVYVDDVVDALLLAARQPKVLGETFLISGEQPITWRHFYDAYEAALGVEATVDISEQDLREAMKKHARDGGTFTAMMDWARSPIVFSELARLPIVQVSLRSLKACLSQEQWQSLKNRVFGCPSRNGKENGPLVKPLHVPDESLLALYQSQARVRVEKANKRLGYVPKFSFEQGMDKTQRFLQWANLA